MTVQSETTRIREVPLEAAARDRAQRFYDRLREHIHSFVENKGTLAEKIGDLLLLVPDMFMLLWRLASDHRVSGKNRGLLISGVAYFIAPIDILPEAILGPIGYVDDLVLAVFILNKMLADTDAAILREHWSGHEDVLLTIQKVLGTVDSLVSEKIVDKLRDLTNGVGAA